MGLLAMSPESLHRNSFVVRQQEWILVVLVVGGIIAFADGLTRPEQLLDAPEDTFTYQAVWGAWVLALVMLPICLQYAKAVRASVREGVVLWFILGMVSFAKDFSYIRWPGAPIFITDVILAGFLVRLFIWPRRFLIQLNSTATKLILLYFGIGLFILARSLLAGHPLLLTLRDFAIALYSLFAFVGFTVIRSWAAVRRVFLFFLLGTILGCINALAWFLHQPGARRYLSPGDYALAAFLCVLVAIERKLVGPVVGYILAAFLAIGVVLANARTVYLELAIMFFLMVLLGKRIRRKVGRVRLKPVIGALVVVISTTIIVAKTRVGSAFMNDSLEQLQSGILDYQDDPNAVFRLAAWGETLSLATQHPILGVGYGVILDPFTYTIAKNGPGSEEVYSVDVDTRPHNTYLTVLYQMGLAGFIALVVLLLYFFKTGWNVLRRFKNSSLSTLLYLALITQFAMVLYGGFNLFLETPFSASIFWLGLGIGLRIQQLLSSQKVTTIVA